jgi:hypothetical protein
MNDTIAPFVSYPNNDFGPAMKGLVIGGLGIFHVFLAQFAIGGRRTFGVGSGRPSGGPCGDRSPFG